MDEAFWYEKQIQNWGREKRMALIEGRLEDLTVLAGNRQLGDEPPAAEEEPPAGPN